MKIVIKNILIKLFVFLFCSLPVWTWAASYEVSTTTSTVDGDTFCGGGQCTSSDTIIIEGGARGDLLFRDFNGLGSYITITNENTNPDSKVVITSDGSVGFGILNLYNCKYVNLRGNNDSDLTYGIKVINDGVPYTVGNVWVYGKSEHIKLSYIECAFYGNTTGGGIGIQVQDTKLTTAWTLSTFEIHHNFIHGARYSGMYLGHNWPHVNNDPYVGTFSIHDNIIEDSQYYGITYKGVNGPDNYIYNNTIKRTGLYAGAFTKQGIGTWGYTTDYYYAEIYGNWIEAEGCGIKLGSDGHLVYDNKILGCGAGGNAEKSPWKHGIVTNAFYGSGDNKVYNNIIIQAKGYGIYGVNNERR